jgi:hypothetical protein
VTANLQARQMLKDDRLGYKGSLPINPNYAALLATTMIDGPNSKDQTSNKFTGYS